MQGLFKLSCTGSYTVPIHWHRVASTLAQRSGLRLDHRSPVTGLLYINVKLSESLEGRPQLSQPYIPQQPSLMSEQTHTSVNLNTSTARFVEELPFSKQFLAKDNAVARRIYMKVMGTAVLGIAVAIFAVMSIYWGSLWKTPVGHLQGWVVVSNSYCFNLYY